MKARSTLMNIYVPVAQVNQVITLQIIGGCDSGPGLGRDINGWYADTFFYITTSVAPNPPYGFASANGNCDGAGNVFYSFIAYPVATADDDPNFYQYEFQADAVGVEGVGVQYLNAFQVQAPAGIYLGVSTTPVLCDNFTYPQSCPTPRPWPIGGGGNVSMVYSSFYGVDNPYSQFLAIHFGACKARGIVSIYDLDASDLALNQVGLSMSITTIHDDGSPAPPVRSLNRAQLIGWNGVFGNPYGGNEDQYIDLPPIGDPSFPSGVFDFEPNTTYVLQVVGLSKDNALQMLPFVSQCVPIASPTCSGLTVFSVTNGTTTIHPGDQIGFSVNVAGANGYTLGINDDGWGDEYPDPRTGGPTTNIVNYFASGAIRDYLRAGGPIAADGLLTFNGISKANNASPLAPFTMFAPNAPQNNVPFNWGFVIPGTGWANVTCAGSFNVTEPPPSVACGPVSPGSADTGQVLNNITVGFSTQAGGPLHNGSVAVSPINGTAEPTFALVEPFAPSTAYTSPAMTATMPLTPGNVAVHWDISATNLSPAKGCDGVIRVQAKPYFKVYGGDVRAGSGYAPTCGAPAAGLITAWGASSGLNNGTGASTQYAAIAARGIDGFSTANGRLGDPGSPIGLTFANNVASNSLAKPFGGDFGGSCMPDYWNSLQNSPGVGAGGAVDLAQNGQFKYTGGGGCAGGVAHKSAPKCYTISASATSSRLAVFIDGDLNITGNITYGAAASIATLPYITVVTCGNIYIDKSVTNISGWFIAVPRANCGGPSISTGGTIYTCTNGFQLVATASMYDNTGTGCRNTLTVRGSFAANDIKFWRTTGTLSSGLPVDPIGSANVAEQFIYGPEMWMNSPFTAPSTTPTKFDSITGLPPIL